MLFVVIGILVIVLNVANIGPFGAWNWEFFGDLWKFTIPFLCAIAWWIYSDVSGLNKRREMERMEKKKQNRREENLVSLGMSPRARRKAPKQQR
jgi:small Trp-rich protein